MRRNGSFLPALLIALCPGLLLGEASVRAEGSLADQERSVRNIDGAALHAKKKSIQVLLPVLKAKRGTPAEAEILMKVMVLEQETAAIEFRIANGRAIQQKKEPDLTSFRETLKSAERNATRLLTQFPSHPSFRRVLYLRAKTRKELGFNDAAIEDLENFIKQSPPADRETRMATFTLAELLTARKDYPAATQHLTTLISGARDIFYPLGLNRLAMIHFFINDYEAANRYAVLEVRHHQASKAVSSLTQQEKALGMLALFHATAIEKKYPSYSAIGLFQLFKEIAPGPLFTKSIVQFAYLLRSKRLASELNSLKQTSLSDYPYREELPELLAVIFEFELNGRLHVALRQSALHLKEVLTASNKTKVVKLWSDAAESLQQAFVIEKSPPAAHELSLSLQQIYVLLLDSSANDNRIKAKIHFNLAEIQFRLRDYASSVKHYRHAVEFGNAASTSKLTTLIAEAEAKAISTSYDAMTEQKIFPIELKTHSVQKAPKAEIQPEIRNWISWIDAYVKKRGHSDVIDGFYFEAVRLLYSRGETADALKRIGVLLDDAPQSKYASAAASLMLDTHVASEDWHEAYRQANTLLKRKTFSDPQFVEKITDISGDAYYKLLEAAYREKNYKQAVQGVDTFLASFPSNRFRGDSLALAANSALALGDKKLALQYFDRLRQNRTMDASNLAVAQQTAAAVAEEEHDFAGAIRQYESYLASRPDPSRALEIQRRILILSWISGDRALLKRLTTSSAICGPTLAKECAQFSMALALLDRTPHPIPQSTDPTSRVYVNLLVLRDGSSRLGLQERLSRMNEIAADWKNLDPMFSVPLLEEFSRIITQSLAASRARIQKVASLWLDKSRIQKRTRWMENMEKSGTQVASLPWLRLRVSTLREISETYADFGKEISALPAPAGLAGADLQAFRASLNEIKAPFEKKAADLASQATLIEQASATEIARSSSARDSELLALAFAETGESMENPMRAQLLKAMQERRVPAVQYLTQAASKNPELETWEIQLARSMVLFSSGARAEALQELETIRSKLDSKSRLYALVPAIRAFFEVQNAEKTHALLQELNDCCSKTVPNSSLNPTDIQMLSAATEWSKPHSQPKLASPNRSSSRSPAGAPQ